MVSSAPTILPSRVRIPSTPSMLFSNCIEIVMRKEQKSTKRERDWPIFLKKTAKGYCNLVEEILLNTIKNTLNVDQNHTGLMYNKMI